MKKIFIFLPLLTTLIFSDPLNASATLANSIRGGVDTVTTYETWRGGSQRVVITGWAGDLNYNDVPITVTVKSPTLGGETVASFKTSTPRRDAQQAYGGHLNKGFNWLIPARFYTGGTYEFSFYVNDIWFGSRKVTIADLGLRGAVDRLDGNTLSGWAVDLDGDDLETQRTAIFLTIDGEQVAMGTTGQKRTDVRNYWAGHGVPSMGANHGFNMQVDVPIRFRDNKTHTIHVYALEFTEGTIQQIGTTQYKMITTGGNIENPYTI